MPPTTKIGLPKGMKLAIPYNQQPDLLDAVAGIAEHVSFLYLPFHPDVALSARVFKGAGDARRYARELDAIARRCARLGIGMNLVANAPHWAIDPRGIALTLERLRGLVPLKVTFADLLAARKARSLLPWTDMSVSCLADVQTAVQALWWKEQVGVSSLVISREINRRPDQIAALARTGLKLGVVSFDDCIPGCQARGCHFKPHEAKTGRAAFRGACDPGSSKVRRQRPWMLAQKEILPGHLRHLAGLICEVKISGRDVPTAEVLRRARLYLEARSLEHPNGYYREPAGAWGKIARCLRDCPDCGWCAEHLSWRPASRGRESLAVPGVPQEHQFRLELPSGGTIRLWLEPVGSSKPARHTVAGYGLYYAADKGVKASAVERAVARAAEALKASCETISPATFGKILARRSR